MYKNFPQCPQCNREWVYNSRDKVYECIYCQLVRSRTDYWVYREYKELKGIMHWAAKCKDRCLWYNTTKSIYLPILPFDITSDQIALYLTFS